MLLYSALILTCKFNTTGSFVFNFSWFSLYHKCFPTELTLNAPIATKVVCFSRLLKCLKSFMANSVDPDQTAPIGAVDQTAPIGAVCSGSMLSASILNLSVKLGNYLQ